MFKLDDPFYRPLWIRVAITAICIGWGVAELGFGNPGWAMIFLALGFYAGWRFFVTFAPPPEEPKEP